MLRGKRVLIAGAILVVLVAIASGGSDDPVTTTPAPVVGGVTQGPLDPPDAATQAPRFGQVAQEGSPVQLDGFTVTILDAGYSARLEFQEPAPGNVYVAFKVRYQAQDQEVFVSSADWSVESDGTDQGQVAFVVHDKWEPSLTFDTLRPGLATEGWLVFETPNPSEFVQVVFDNDPFTSEPAFTYRARCCN